MGIFKVLVVNRGYPPSLQKFFFFANLYELGRVKKNKEKVEKMKKVCPDPHPC